MLLEIGDTIRYQGLGAGKVVRHEERSFQGRQRVFAVISFPHRDMTVQLPIGDPAVTKKLSHTLSAEQGNTILARLEKKGKRLARTWDQREDHGTAVLKKGGPDDWVALLCSYATARAEGLSIAASDADIVRAAQELVAAEVCAALDIDYDEALSQVLSRYHDAHAVVA